ncbi:MAG: dihydroorotate dehydrogenase electron transfer subunit, partial [Acidobacteria bacterium]|nr:dihydroorotate dehydrogenase electron transfer subunit [Acidobacteriota bacterium]
MYDRRLAIESVTRVGPGQFVLGFESREIAAQCRPGHFVMISVAESIDPLLRRPMAIYRVVRDDAGAARGFTLLIEVIGRGTALLEQQNPGDHLEVLGPLGVPFDLPVAGQAGGKHLLVMGGVGAAPFPFVAEELLEAGHRVHAFVGARTAAALLCVDDFRELGIPVEIATDDGSDGFHGFVVGPLQEYLQSKDCAGAVLYACGPVPMMRAVHDIAVANDLPLQVSFEAPMACRIGARLSWWVG